uniref:Uncharacterized protein n=1 Tax=Dromaius novaehollandiae TaxID=8790 RepID=A0A8C4KLD4_DRONO
METFKMAEYVTRMCISYIKHGYSFKAIAILCSTQKAAEEFYQILEPALKRQVRQYRVSIQCFSGLESVVFGTHPMPAQREISLSFTFHIYILSCTGL